MLGRLASVGGFTALSRVAGFLRDVLMAAVLGAGPVSDAFMVAFRLPNNFRAIFAEGAFSAAFLPRYAAAAAKDGTAPSSPAARFANDVFAWQFAAQLVLLVLALVFMRQIIAVLAPGFSDNPDQQALAVELTRITFPYLFAIAIVTQLSSMLNAAEKFRAAAAAPILLNLSMIVALSCAQFFPTPAHAVAYGVLFAGLLELLFIVRAAAHTGLALRLKRPRWNAEIRDFISALGAAVIGAGSVQIGLFVDTLIASFLPAGDLTALYYADRINQLPMGVVGVAIGTVLLPEMSAKLARNDEKGASIAQNRAIIIGLLTDAALHRRLLHHPRNADARALRARRLQRRTPPIRPPPRSRPTASDYRRSCCSAASCRPFMRAATPRRPCARRSCRSPPTSR